MDVGNMRMLRLRQDDWPNASRRSEGCLSAKATSSSELRDRSRVSTSIFIFALEQMVLIGFSAKDSSSDPVWTSLMTTRSAVTVDGLNFPTIQVGRVCRAQVTRGKPAMSIVQPYLLGVRGSRALLPLHLTQRDVDEVPRTLLGHGPYAEAPVLPPHDHSFSCVGSTCRQEAG
uniref:Uncharacterized protein n=1 Tax=Guillardia theta TaxID=55529 RepID=A0A7S4P2W8_GUITH